MMAISFGSRNFNYSTLIAVKTEEKNHPHNEKLVFYNDVWMTLIKSNFIFSILNTEQKLLILLKVTVWIVPPTLWFLQECNVKHFPTLSLSRWTYRSYLSLWPSTHGRWRSSEGKKSVFKIYPSCSAPSSPSLFILSFFSSVTLLSKPFYLSPMILLVNSGVNSSCLGRKEMDWMMLLCLTA